MGRSLVTLIVGVILGVAPVSGQEPQQTEKEEGQTGQGAETLPVLQLPTPTAAPDAERLRVTLRFMAGYGHDSALASLGSEKQGRVGYVIIGLSGKITDHFSYVVEINPVNETSALPSCGEDHFFYPNTPSNIGPNVECDPDGRTRVDDYRFVALDFINQQGSIRQAWLAYNQRPVGFRIGRFILPMGFYPEDVGSFSAKDATHIQRINAEANFGLGVSYTKPRHDGRPLATVNIAGFLGEGNRDRDYDYFYFQGLDLDTNSALTALASGSVHVTPELEVRAAFKKGFTGSKVERLPNFFASKRHDDAVVVSARYKPVEFATLFGEWARYTWGPTRTSAELLGFDREPIKKPGYYIGAEVSHPVTGQLRLAMVATHEELSRDDSLIKFLEHQGLYDVAMGRKERSTTFRWYAEIANAVTIAVYRNALSNPYPWVSGIYPVAGPRAFTGRGSEKWGIVARFHLSVNWPP